MSNEIRLIKWESFRERITQLEADVRVEVKSEFRPIWKNLAAAELCRRLKTLAEFVREQTEQAEHEMSKFYDAFDMYNAWRLGLCPSVMKAMKDAGEDAGSIENWRNIADFLTRTEVNREDTISAIKIWLSVERQKV